jgi:perosamine synthetase
MTNRLARLAIDGGTPVRQHILPYGHQTIGEEDFRAVVDALGSDWLTTGPKVREFEQAFARYADAGEAVVVNSGTAALHTAMHALGIGPGDDVIVPALTFVASANCVLYQGATPVFADVEPDTLLIDSADVAAKITARTRAIIAVDYAGQPCDYDALRAIARRHGLGLVADACHSLGGSYKDRAVGTLADLSVFSLHPVKAMTTGEGGMVTTESFESAHRMRCFRNHGVTSNHFQRGQQGSWLYDMADLGFNYRLSDIQCALGLNQLKRLSGWIERRRVVAMRYDDAFASLLGVTPLALRPGRKHAYHLYVIRLNEDRLGADRGRVFAALRAEGIGVNVHYLPVYLHSYYRERFGTRPGLCPQAETAYEEILSLPIYPGMSDEDTNDVIEALWKVVTSYGINTRTTAVAGTR